MKRKIFTFLMGATALLGLFLIMSAVGSDDYRVMQGLPGLSWWELIGRSALGFGCFLLSAFFWRVSDAI